MKKKSLLIRKIKDRILRVYSAAAVMLAVGVMLWILGTVAADGFKSFSWSFLLNPSKPYGSIGGGIANALLGTVLITLGAAVMAVPGAICAGICLSEFKEYRRTAAFLRFSANVMMGMPSVLVGLFVYMVLVVPTGHFSGFAASVALAILMFPVIMRTTEDMLAMVPYALRESALALGMTRMRATVCSPAFCWHCRGCPAKPLRCCSRQCSRTAGRPDISLNRLPTCRFSSRNTPPIHRLNPCTGWAGAQLWL